jgi:hypothetical protein
MSTIVLFRTPSGYLARYSNPLEGGIGGTKTQPMPFPRTTNPEYVVRYVRTQNPHHTVEIGNPDVFWQGRQNASI